MGKLFYNDKLHMQTLHEQGRDEIISFQLPWQRVKVEHCCESWALLRKSTVESFAIRPSGRKSAIKLIDWPH